MIKNTQQDRLDETDWTLLKVLQGNGNITIAELSRMVHLSPPAVHTRIRRLETAGYIDKYVALLKRESVGFGLLCFIQVSLPAHEKQTEVKAHTAIRAMPEVLECYHVTGEYDYVLKVVLRNSQHLEQFVNETLTTALEHAHIRTSVVLSDIKTSTQLPL